MITLKQWMEIVEYRITEGNEYLWSCYGSDAYSLDSWNGAQEGHSFYICFDTRTQEVYEVQAHDFKRNRAYRLINPFYKEGHDAEAREKKIRPNQAWDEVDFVDLDTDEDWLDKARAIYNDEDYDTRVDVPLVIDDDVLFNLMKLAHTQDITLNQLIERILTDEVKQASGNEFGTVGSDLSGD